MKKQLEKKNAVACGDCHAQKQLTLHLEFKVRNGHKEKKNQIAGIFLKENQVIILQKINWKASDNREKKEE